MASAGSNPPVPDDRGPPRRVPAGRDLGRYATGQLLAFTVVLLLGLPLLPLIVLVVAGLRYRDHRDRRRA